MWFHSPIGAEFEKAAARQAAKTILDLLVGQESLLRLIHAAFQHLCSIGRMGNQEDRMRTEMGK